MPFLGLYKTIFLYIFHRIKKNQNIKKINTLKNLPPIFCLSIFSSFIFEARQFLMYPSSNTLCTYSKSSFIFPSLSFTKSYTLYTVSHSAFSLTARAIFPILAQRGPFPLWACVVWMYYGLFNCSTIDSYLSLISFKHKMT